MTTAPLTDGLADAPVGYFEVNPEGRLVAVNDALGRIVGRRRAEVFAGSIAELLPNSSRLFLQTHVLPTLELNGRVDEVYLSLRHGTGDPIPVLMNGVRRREPEGGFVDLFVVLPVRRRAIFERELVHARQEAERALEGERVAIAQAKALQAQLAVRERLAAIGTLAAGVAHEINNPLTYVLANLDMIADSVAADRPLSETDLGDLISEVRDGVIRIRDVVASLRGLSRVDDTHRNRVEIRRVVDVALKLAGSALLPRARVEVDVTSPSPVILSEESRLIQVLINLLVNAGQAASPSSVATNLVRVRGFVESDEHVVLEVSDNGPGVPDDLQSRIFDPFFTTKPMGEGTGLGLWVSHEIVSSLGGTLTLSSEPGRGATFRVTLPNVKPPVAKPATQSVVTVRGEVVGQNILLVEDDPALQRTLVRMLRGHRVELCSSGRIALERLRQEGFAGFDAIVTVLLMPETSGMELFRVVRSRSPALAERFVFMVDVPTTDVAADFLSRIDNPTVPKPFQAAELRGALDRVLRVRLRSTEHS
jgi:two-component system, cell cycle sensor histidine kinase and response regulator CckA